MMNKMTSIPLGNISCQDKTFCFDNETLTTIVMQKLRIPIPNLPKAYTRSQEIDTYGDHFLCYNRCHKTETLDRNRNALYLVIKKILPLI